MLHVRVARRQRLRRAFLTVLALALIAGIYAVFIEPNRLVVHRERLDLPHWNGPPLRIVALSDLHFGSLFMDRDKARTIVDLVNAEKPDVIVLLGDYVVGSSLHTIERPTQDCIGELGRLDSRLGKFAILGNHDWWSDGPLLKDKLPGLGIQVLENDAVKVADSFWVWGLADLWERRPDYASALEAIPTGEPIIVLTHNPDVFPRVPERVALTLAGHTHGGQVRLPLLGSMIVPSSFGQRYAVGRVHERDHDLFVTTGIGTSVMPIRFGVAPEILVLDLSGSNDALKNATVNAPR